MSAKKNTTIRPGIYRHFKGNQYQVFETATHSETDEVLVVYRCLYGDYSLGVRPLSMFLETVEYDGCAVPRFEFVKSSGSLLDHGVENSNV